MGHKPTRMEIEVQIFGVVKNRAAAQIFAAIWWAAPVESVERGGRQWVIKSDQDFIKRDKVRVSPRTIRYALKRLIAWRLIEIISGGHPDKRAPHSRYLRIHDDIHDFFGRRVIESVAMPA